MCSLREQVVEARFSLVHVTSVARKASTIAQVRQVVQNKRRFETEFPPDCPWWPRALTEVDHTEFWDDRES